MTAKLSPRAYDHVVKLIRERPWGILPSYLGLMRELVAMHIRGERLSDVEIHERLAAAQAQNGDRPGQSQAAGVAILPLYGPLVPKADMFTEMSGATSIQGFMKMFRSALVDTEVKAIVIDVDSPGGMVDLVPEAATEIRNARGQKPIVAVANTLMASCAYWLGCQADEVVASPSAWVGSIGVYTEHDDLSAFYEAAGVNHTYISAGKFKTEGNEYEPLSEETRRHLQELIDDGYGMFVNDVAKARNATPEAVRNGYGQGRVLTAKMAVAEGLADRIDTLDATVKRMVWVAARQKPAQAHADLRAFEAAGGVLIDPLTGEFEVPAGFTGKLPEADYAPGAKPLAAPLTPDDFEFERELLERRQPA